MRAFLLALIATTAASADPIPGADDPAFRIPFERALQGDDPTALIELHAAAEAGNTAALLALPSVNEWLRTELPFAKRKRIARVNGTPLAEAVVAADPVAALWDGGEVRDADGLLGRVRGLMEAGETDKATFLFISWFNQTGARPSMPDWLFDLPLPKVVLAQTLLSRYRSFDPAIMADTEALIARRLKADDPTGFLAMAMLAGMHRPGSTPAAGLDRLAAIAEAAGLDPVAVGQRMTELAPSLLLSFAWGEPLDPAIALAGAALMMDDPGLVPLRALCTATCPDTLTACTAAFVAAFGPPQGRSGNRQPDIRLISEADFLKTPRGGTLLLMRFAGRDDPRLPRMKMIAACLADHLLSKSQ